jgi:hypothetical protein
VTGTGEDFETGVEAIVGVVELEQAEVRKIIRMMNKMPKFFMFPVNNTFEKTCTQALSSPGNRGRRDIAGGSYLISYFSARAG